jgi:hypothetical protein
MTEEKKEAPAPAEAEEKHDDKKKPFVPKFQKGNNPFTNPLGNAKGGKAGYKGPAGGGAGRLPPRSGSRGT